MSTNLHMDDIIKRVKRRYRGVSDPQLMHATRDWFIGLFLALALCLGVSLYLYRMYLSFQPEALSTVVDTSPVVEYQAVVAARALERIMTEQEIFASRFGNWSFDPAAMAVEESDVDMTSNEELATTTGIQTEAEIDVDAVADREPIESEADSQPATGTPSGVFELGL